MESSVFDGPFPRQKEGGDEERNREAPSPKKESFKNKRRVYFCGLLILKPCY
jgi:hypothetical protein